ncbi:hypothetical protein POMI540_3876 [Schizosaccharomyces pombe]
MDIVAETQIEEESLIPDATSTPLETEVVPDTTLRKTALHLAGVDNLSEEQVKGFISAYAPESQCTIEWINDNECNVVYADDDVSRNALFHLIMESPTEFSEELEYQTKPHPTVPTCQFKIRYARYGDKKVKSAHLYSRYYLFHGDPREEKAQKSKSKRNQDERGSPLDERLGPKVSDLTLMERIFQIRRKPRKSRRDRRSRVSKR